jgi:hypothetical protein
MSRISTTIERLQRFVQIWAISVRSWWPITQTILLMLPMLLILPIRTILIVLTYFRDTFPIPEALLEDSPYTIRTLFWMVGYFYDTIGTPVGYFRNSFRVLLWDALIHYSNTVLIKSEGSVLRTFASSSAGFACDSNELSNARWRRCVFWG